MLICDPNGVVKGEEGRGQTMLLYSHGLPHGRARLSHVTLGQPTRYLVLIAREKMGGAVQPKRGDLWSPHLRGGCYSFKVHLKNCVLY
jgi:hypothetical protein